MLAFSLSAVLLSVAPAAAADLRSRVLVEVQPEASRVLDARLTQRLILLELSDVDVPPPRDIDAEAQSLYFRVIASSPTTLTVELWELGVPHGSRTVSALGSLRLRARRVALAAAELTRQLRQRRLIEQRLARERLAAPAEPVAPDRGFPVRGRFQLDAGAIAAAGGPNQFWLVGPRLAGALRFDSGPRLALGASFLAGGVNALPDPPSMRWLELSLVPSYTARFGPSFGLDVGLLAAVSALHVGGSGVDGDPSQHDTWSARAVAQIRFEPRLGSWTWFSFGPDVGVILRRVPVQAPDGQTERLGGVWLGLGASVVLDPSAP